MKAISILCAVLLTLCLCASAATLLTEGFNAATTPAGWAAEIINDSCGEPPARRPDARGVKGQRGRCPSTPFSRRIQACACF